LATATDKLVPNENKAAREATMRAIKQLVLTCVVLGGFNTLLQAQTAAPQTQSNTLRAVQSFLPVTDETLRNSSPENWLMLRGNYQGWGLQQARSNQQNKRQEPATRVVAGNGARHQRVHPNRLQRCDVSW
jgi:hypothetical protein